MKTDVQLAGNRLYRVEVEFCIFCPGRGEEHLVQVAESRLYRVEIEFCLLPRSRRVTLSTGGWESPLPGRNGVLHFRLAPVEARTTLLVQVAGSTGSNWGFAFLPWSRR